MCLTPNQNAGVGALPVAGMPAGVKYTLEQARAMCLLNSECLSFSFPSSVGYWGVDGVQKPLFDAKTKKGAVSFYKDAQMTATEGNEWGMGMHIKSHECADIQLCEMKERNVGTSAILVQGMPKGESYRLESAKAKCRQNPLCYAFTFASESGYVNANGQAQELYSTTTRQSKVNFYSYPDMAYLKPKETGMSVYTKCGPATDWLQNEQSWMTDSSQQRSVAGKLFGQCKWNFEHGSLQGWQSPQTLMCDGAFYGQPVSHAVCNQTNSNNQTNYTQCEQTNADGEFFLRSDFSGEVNEGQGPRGVIASPSFKAGSGAKMSFLISGGNNPWQGTDMSTASIACDAGSQPGLTAVTLEKLNGPVWTVLESATGEHYSAFWANVQSHLTIAIPCHTRLPLLSLDSCLLLWLCPATAMTVTTYLMVPCSMLCALQEKIRTASDL